MNTLRKLLIGIALGGAALATAPAALADKYVENHYYGYSQYRDHDRHYDHHRDRHHERRHDRHRHDRYCEHRGYGHHAPVRKRVVVIEQPRHYPSHDYYSEPRYERQAYSGAYRSATPTILGGIIGGAVGNTMGKGHGRDAATVAGAILGASIGRDMGEYY